MDVALTGGAGWGMQEDAFELDEEGGTQTLAPCGSSPASMLAPVVLSLKRGLQEGRG